MNTAFLILSVVGVALHFVNPLLGMLGGSKSPSATPASPGGGSATPSTGRPVLDLIHYILAAQNSPAANGMDKDLQLLRQLLDNLGIPSLDQVGNSLKMPPSSPKPA